MILTIIWGAVLTVLVVLLLLVLLTILGHICAFHLHKCPHCGHPMEYKGLKEDKEESHYIFYCSKCGKWQQIPKGEFFHNSESTTYESR